MEWRDTADPYRIWVSEIMLQQTRVETVAPYYTRFLFRFPDVASLAAATPDEVLSLWEGLGYYARARNLHDAARILLERHGGNVPSSVEELMELPGIGRSTAGAIAAIAFGRDDPILDANVRRVVARLFAVPGNLRSAASEKMLWELSARLVRKGAGRSTALALMDLGAEICHPKSPALPAMSGKGALPARLRGLQEEIPPKAPRKSTPHYDVVAAVFRGNGGALFRRAPRKVPWRVMGVPFREAAPAGNPGSGPGTFDPGETRDRDCDSKKNGTVRHAYSHYRITLHGFLCEPAGGTLPSGEGAAWVLPGGESTCALPRADRKLIEHGSERGTDESRGDAEGGGPGDHGDRLETRRGEHGGVRGAPHRGRGNGDLGDGGRSDVGERPGEPDASYAYFAPGEGYRGARLPWCWSGRRSEGRRSRRSASGPERIPRTRRWSSTSPISRWSRCVPS